MFVFTASVPLNGAQGLRRVHKLPKCPICFCEITQKLTLKEAASCARSASTFISSCVGMVGKEGFCRERQYSL